MKYFKLNILSLLILPILFIGCTSKPQVVETKAEIEAHKMPDWFLLPPMNNNHYIYGVGQSSDKDSSKKNALVDALSTISIEISSDYKSNLKYRNNNGLESSDKNIEVSIKSKLMKIYVNNYDTMKMKKLGFKNYISLIRIDKTKLFSSINGTLNRKIEKFNIFQNSSITNLEKIAKYRDFLPEIEKEFKTISILKTLKPDYNEKIFTDKYKKSVENYNKLINENKIKVIVIDNNGEVYNKTLIDIVKSSLTKDGMVITDGDDNRYIAELSQEHTNTYPEGFSLTKSVFNISIKDVRTGDRVSNTRIKTKGVSSTDYKSSQNKSYHAFAKGLNKNGIMSVLNF